MNRHFQAKLPKPKNCDISEAIRPISPEFDDVIHTTNGTSWAVHRSRTGNTSPFLQYAGDVRKLECVPIPNMMVAQLTVVAPCVQCRKVWLMLTT